MSRFLNILRARKAVKEAHFMSRADLLKLQESRWRAMVRYALQVSPFYRRHFAGIDVERCQLTDLPVITKEMLIANWDEIVPDKRLHRAALDKFLQDPNNWGRLYHGRWMVSMTSGTTGAALPIVHDIAVVDWGHASQNLRNSNSPHTSRQPQLFRSRLKVLALVPAASPATSAALYSTRPWVGSLFCTYQQLDIAAPWSEVVAKVQRIQPDIMMGYGSVFGRLAQAQLQGELDLHIPKDRGYILAGGDAMTPGIRDLCIRAFGIEPLNTYGCGEALGMARQWLGMKHMLIHDDMVALEAVDAADKPVPEGVLSDHALVTPLHNKAMPLLRYRLNDRLKLGAVDEHWPLQRIDQIVGRSNMVYVFRTPERKVFIGVHFIIIMDFQPDVALHQFRQTGPASVECLVVPKTGVDAAVLLRGMEEAMRRSLDENGCNGVTCSARIVAQLSPDPRTGKVEQNVPLADETV
jgi:phenylacetate-CoA ligase